MDGQLFSKQASKQASKREYWVDFIKGVMICLVVLGHSGIPSMLLHPIYMFHMPIFFVISGLLYDDRGDGVIVFLRRKAQSLLYPYVVLGTIIIVYNTALSEIYGNNSYTEVLKRIVALAYGNYIWDNNVSYIGVLWFVVALFCSEMLYYIAIHLGKNKKVIFTIIVTTVGIAFSVLNVYQKVRLPLCLDIACIAFLFFYVGEWFREINRLRLIQGIGAVGIGFLIGAVNYFLMTIFDFKMLRVDMLYMNYGIFPLFLISASLISIGFMTIVKELYNKYRFEFVEHLGRTSLLIMVIHLYVIQLIGKLTENCIIKFIFTSIVSIIVAFLVEKYIPFLYKFPADKKRNND